MLKVTNKLGLVSEANEDAVLEAIAKIENKAQVAEDSLAKMQDALNAKKAECDELSNKLAEATKKAEDEAEAKAKAEAENMEAKAKNMVEGFAKSGRIKNDTETITKWTNKAKSDFEGVKALIEDLPVTKVANKIEVSTVTNELALTNVVAKQMRDVREKYKL